MGPPHWHLRQCEETNGFPAASGFERGSVKLTKFARVLLILSAAASWQASAQTWDTSGNGLLKNSYYFRQVLYLVGDENGDLEEATAVYGTIAFSGTGTYSANITVFDSGEGIPQSET